jgi:dTDP-4-dehydrorhamnose reductase
MPQKKSLIVGASGQVGTQMLAVLGERAMATSRIAREGWLKLDVAELAEAAQAAELLDACDLDSIYCVGGMTWVDGCEADLDLAHRTNARGPELLAAYARQRGVPYVFFSTDYVFDGRSASMAGRSWRASSACCKPTRRRWCCARRGCTARTRGKRTFCTA